MQLILENVRSFAGPHNIPLRPLTILTGENSAGKSTLLAALSAVCDTSSFPMQPRLNDPPYSLGSFETIATYKGGKYGRAKSFSLGFARDSSDRDDALSLCATYNGNLGQIEVEKINLKTPVIDLSVTFGMRSGQRTANATLSHSGETRTFRVVIEQWPTALSGLGFLDFLIFELLSRDRGSQKNIFPASLVRQLQRAVPRSLMPNAASVAPIRTKPRRTYDQFIDDYTPEGEHIPYVLFRHLIQKSVKGDQELLREALERFGRESGLFQRLTVKKLGSTVGDPFQILVSGSGRPHNLIDVGYGVSQALPIVVQTILSSKGRIVLLQQPEVHLHPRAQAALGSFFVEIASKSDKYLIIETHSDFIVDRIRQEIAASKISCDDAEIIYLEKPRLETVSHILGFDQLGNILNAPPSYREFFLMEELNLITRRKNL